MSAADVETTLKSVREELKAKNVFLTWSLHLDGITRVRLHGATVDGGFAYENFLASYLGEHFKRALMAWARRVSGELVGLDTLPAGFARLLPKLTRKRCDGKPLVVRKK